MSSIQRLQLPADALLARYAQDAYTDCYATDIPASISHEQFVNAFYTTWAFKTERLILKLVVAKPSTDPDAAMLAAGTTDSFAAWTVEARGTNQLLMCDYLRRTRSWLMMAPININGASGTRLYFGSAVTKVQNSKTGEQELGLSFNALLGFHKVYSRVLLHAAKSKLARH